MNEIEYPAKTPVVARHLQINVFTLFGAIRAERFPLPAKDTSGHFTWTAADVQRAREAMAVDRRRKGTRPEVAKVG